MIAVLGDCVLHFANEAFKDRPDRAPDGASAILEGRLGIRPGPDRMARRVVKILEQTDDRRSLRGKRKSSLAKAIVEETPQQTDISAQPTKTQTSGVRR